MRRRLGQPALHLALATGGAFVLAPFAVMVTTSLKEPGQALSGGFWPAPLTLASYREALGEVPIWRYFANGVLVSGGTFVLQVAVCLPAAFALARLRFRGARLGLWVVLGCLILPTQVTAVPVYIGLQRLHLLDTHAALVLPFVGSAFGVYLFRQFLLAIPGSVLDAARIDGAATSSLLWRVVLPQARPALVAFGIFSIVGHWNDYFWASFVLRTERAATVPFGVVEFLNQEAGGRFGPQMAVATLSVAPLIAGFVVAQRWMVSGMRFGGQVE